MKISLNWLKDYVSIGISADKLAHKLTMAGLEVEKTFSVDGDTVFELEITPNRPDCLNMMGIAREISAILNKTKEFPQMRKLSFPNNRCNISIEDKAGCSRYIGTVMEDVHIEPTSVWIKKRLTSIGIRSINNIVDITNFCLMETGQPLHAFDYDKISGGKIIVRRAKKGEKIVTLDDEERELDPSILVIADEKRPIAIAGIMGGKETEVTVETKNILLESAHFNPILIRRAVRKLALSSDSSYRFERGVDYDTVEVGAQRALLLIRNNAKGTIIARSDVSSRRQKTTKPKIVISKDQINAYLGTDITASQSKNILKKLDFEVAAHKKDVLTVTPPPWRKDIKQDVDVVEEVARIIGYDNLPLRLPQIQVTQMLQSPTRAIKKNIYELFLAQGFDEVITYTMISQPLIEKSGQAELKGLKIRNPLTCDQEILRPSMLPSLLSILQTNINKGQKGLKIFEIGKVYEAKGEKETLAIMAVGQRDRDWRKLKQEELDFYDIKGALQQVLKRIGLKDAYFYGEDHSIFEEGKSATVGINNKEIGVMGEIKEDILSDWDIKIKKVYFAQVNLEEVFGHIKMEQKYHPLGEYPSVVRDISLAVKEEISFQQVQDIIFQTSSEILSTIEFKEQYLGDKITQGFRGIIFSLKYQSLERTLREEEVSIVHEKVCKALVNELGAEIR